MPSLIIYGDTSLFENAGSIETRDDLVRHMFVTLEPSPDQTLWIRAVPLEALAGFKGTVYQLDRDEKQDAIILRQVSMSFWPWGDDAVQPAEAPRQDTTLDEILHAAFADFYEALSKPGTGWFAKERDCVNRFAMAHLVPACTPGCVLHHPAQIGIEIGVKQPDGIGTRPASPKDLVIWEEPYSTSWSSAMLPMRAPLAILEWKSQRPEKAKQKTDDDREWLCKFTEQNPNRLGYSVLVDWTDDGVLREVTVSRCQGGEWSEEWFRMAQPS